MVSENDVVIPPADQIQADIEYLRSWISQEPHLPPVDDEKWLRTFLCINKFSLEKTKFKIENYYSLRSKFPEIFKNRDPMGADVQRVRSQFRVGLTTERMKDGSRVVQVKYEDPHIENSTAYLKRLFMIWDAVFLDDPDPLGTQTTIIDMKDIKYSVMLQFMPVLFLQGDIMNKAYTARDKAIHFINVPSWAPKIFQTLMDYFPNKLRGRVHFHSETKSTLFETVEKDFVCSEFGGDGPSIAECDDETQKRLERHRKWFEEQNNICTNELLRRKDFHVAEVMQGSFRKLQVD